MDYFDQPQGAVLGAVANGMLYGNLLAFLITSWVCDRFGRVKAISGGSVVVFIGIIVESTSINLAMLLVGRFILGFGLAFAITSAPLLIAETAYPSHRPFMTGITPTVFFFGSIVAAWTTYGTSKWPQTSEMAWRVPTILQCIFPIIQWALVYWVPESPRYLVSRGREQEAREMLIKWHLGGNETHIALVDFEMAEIVAAIQLDSQNKNEVSYLDFLKTRGNRHRLFIMCFIPIMTQLSGNSVLAYFLHLVLDSIGITSTHQQLVLNDGITIFNFFFAVVIIPFMDKFGRRKIYIYGTSAMLVTYVIWTILSALNQKADFNNASLGQSVLAFIFLYYACYSMTNTAIQSTYMTEVLPYHLRAKGYVINQVVLTGALLFNGFVTPIAMDAFGATSWRYYIVWCCVIALELVVVYFAFPETKNLTLEEVAAVFGDSPLDGLREENFET